MSAYFVAPDGHGDLTLWQGDGPDDSAATPVIARHDLGWSQNVWPVLVGVLTEDPETVERVARAIWPTHWGRMSEGFRDARRDDAVAVLRALRGEQ